MTTIAWDGKVLAADKRMVHAGLYATVTKIRRIGGLLVAAAGDFDSAQEMFAWIEAGRVPADFPSIQKESDRYVGILIIEGGKVFKYERSAIPFEIEEPYFAIGSGRDFALAAMACGRTAVEAVEVAALFDVGTGNGVDWMEAPLALRGPA